MKTLLVILLSALSLCVSTLPGNPVAHCQC